MKTLKVRNKNLLILLDDEDYPRIAAYKWYCSSTRNLIRTKKINGKTHSYPLAPEIMYRPGVMFDHKDRDFLNCQKHNLREATDSQNQMNKEKMYKGSSTYKGVDFHKRIGKWRARISINKKTVHIGFYPSQEQAAHAYNAKAVELFKEFAYLNIIS